MDSASPLLRLDPADTRSGALFALAPDPNFQPANAMITITEKASGQVARLREQAGMSADHHLRVGVTSGGCSGLEYTLGFDKERQSDDIAYESNGLTLLIDNRSDLYLDGTELDFSDGLAGKGFHFKNPNAARTCSCGESFSV